MELPDLQALQAAIEDGRAGVVLPELEHLTRQLPAYPTAYVLLARACEAEQRLDEAQQAWQHAYFLLPGSPIIEEGLRRTAHPMVASIAADSTDARQTLSNVGDLDRLIEDLESARIDPVPDPDAIPAPDLDDDLDDMVSETLARIYAAQEQYDEAARVYAKLADQQPGRAADFRKKAAEMRARRQV